MTDTNATTYEDDLHTCGYEHDPATTTCEGAEEYWLGEWSAEAKWEMEAEARMMFDLENSGMDDTYMDRLHGDGAFDF